MSDDSRSGADAGAHTDALKRSPLDDRHRALGARMAEFGGWEMPISYEAGTIDEHLACRRRAALFDVSHLGTVRLRGADASERVQAAFTNDLQKVAPGRAQYTHLLDPHDASVVDDIIVWWRDAELFDVMPNASNTDRVRAAIGGDDVTGDRAVLAVQGPQARAAVESVIPAVTEIGRFRVGDVEWNGTPCVIAGTGYTGEPGVEIAVPTESAGDLWDVLLEAGVEPAGLGARDTLRLEAGLPLHGHELGAGITSLQAGLGWVVGWDKPTFIGREAALAERERGVSRHLVGLAVAGRRPARDGCEVFVGDSVVGSVTSGNFSPVLGHAIAMAFVVPSVEVGAEVEIDVRGKRLAARVVDLPFV